MPDRMLQFTRLPQHQPDKRGAAERKHDFAEIYRDFAIAEAGAQSSRCSQCGVPFCSVHCPLNNNIPDWLKLTAEGRLDEAYEVSAATNNFPEICGRICPQDRLCEGNCVIEKGFDAVTIGAVERFITDNAFAQGWVKPVRPREELSQSIGIVGAGPGGLAAAEELRRRGYQVHVYERHDRPGGLLIYGIPSFKLEKDIVLRRGKLLEDGGVVFHLNTEVGRDVTFAELRARHDAVLIATGVYKARDIFGPGSGLPGIVKSLDFLIASNRMGLGDTVPEFDSGELSAGGKHVVVIGGGDTAMDCVRTSVRQGAASVTCLYRRDRANMPGSMGEVKNAEEEGVHFMWLSAPEAFLGENTVSGVRAVHMRLGLPDASGRQSVEVVPGSHFTVKADLVIKALGFDPEPLPDLWSQPTLAVTRAGTVKIDHRSFETSLAGVFAAGDIVRGASLVVWAIRDGRDAAAAIHAYLQPSARQGYLAAAE
jgi:glutamate synthase (NADPH/NADH) small chain